MVINCLIISVTRRRAPKVASVRLVFITGSLLFVVKRGANALLLEFVGQKKSLFAEPTAAGGSSVVLAGFGQCMPLSIASDSVFPWKFSN